MGEGTRLLSKGQDDDYLLLTIRLHLLKALFGTFFLLSFVIILPFLKIYLLKFQTKPKSFLFVFLSSKKISLVSICLILLEKAIA